MGDLVLRLGDSELPEELFGLKEFEREAFQTLLYSLARDYETDTLMKKIRSYAQHAVNAERATIFVKNGNMLEVRYQSQVKELPDNAKIAVGTGIAGLVALNGTAEMIANAQEDKRFYKRFDDTTGYVTRSLLCVPMKRSDGSVFAVFEVNRFLT